MSKRNSKHTGQSLPSSTLVRSSPIRPSSPHGRPRLLQNGFAAVKECRIGMMMYNINDMIGGRGLDLYGEAKWADVEFLGQILQAGDVAIDVGANIGNHTVFYAKKVSPGGVVFALEPQRVTFEILCANLVLNGLVNVIPMQAGAGEAEGKLNVPLLDPNAAQNFGAVSIECHANGESIRIMPLDSLELKRCKLIKIDVEGMEYKVILGAEKTIKSCRPFLYVENNNRDGSPDTVQKLYELGYKCWWKIAPHYNPNNYFNNKENIWADLLPESNMVCVPEENNIKVTGLEPVISPEDNWIEALKRQGLISG